MKSVANILGRMGYDEQIRSPEWAAFSADIRAKHPFCEQCRRSDARLNVHHIFYDWRRKLWEYEPSELIVLCEPCHDALGKQLSVFRKTVFGKLDHQSFTVLNGALSVGLTQYDPLVFAHALAEFVSSPSMVERYAKAWRV